MFQGIQGDLQTALMFPGGKLEGILWYAKGDKWLFEKLVEEDFEEKIGGYIFEFDIDEKKIYKMSNMKNIVRNKKTYKNKLNWVSLVLDPNYCGLYANNIHYMSIFENCNPYIIFSLFDVDSGCIWNSSCVKSYKLLAKYDEKKENL